ncbi:MAG TPA: hypothetical protein VMR34_05110 [Candidatus Saccharimonadales bacterium]|nr:hypothetical protein [Candidatus Saccharimonadales bacterium]
MTHDQTNTSRRKLFIRLLLGLVILAVFAVVVSRASASTLSGSGSVGLTGTIPSPPPSTAATISSPTNGQVFTKEPIVVQGICPSGLLIKLYINGIFSGAAQCTNGSYSITTGLFNDQNSLQVIDYDALDQAGPGSNIVVVTYQPANVGSNITLTSNYAKLGANPGDSIVWPIIISGGAPPYAISVDWGDGTSQELLSQSSAGTFNITHAYQISGIYNIIIRATDQAGNEAFLQLVGVANGPASQASNGTGAKGSTPSKTTTTTVSKLPQYFLWIIGVIILIFIPTTFWLGKRHEQKRIKTKLSRGDEPF